MATSGSDTHTNIWRLILIPSVITLAVTILRLVGELMHWNPVLFGRSAGGGGALVGISWLAIVFGVYFALKLAWAGDGPRGIGSSVGLAVIGLVIFVLGGLLGLNPKLNYPGHLVVGCGLFAIAAALQYRGWPQLCKTLVAYAYAARIPVAIVMFFAMQGNWGTHYDAVPPGMALPGFWASYFYLGLLPQLILWIAFTVVLGTLFGSIAAALVRKRELSPTPAPSTT